MLSRPPGAWLGLVSPRIGNERNRASQKAGHPSWSSFQFAFIYVMTSRFNALSKKDRDATNNTAPSYLTYCLLLKEKANRSKQVRPTKQSKGVCTTVQLPTTSATNLPQTCKARRVTAPKLTDFGQWPRSGAGWALEPSYPSASRSS